MDGEALVVELLLDANRANSDEGEGGSNIDRGRLTTNDDDSSETLCKNRTTLSVLIKITCATSSSSSGFNSVKRAKANTSAKEREISA